MHYIDGIITQLVFIVDVVQICGFNPLYFIVYKHICSGVLKGTKQDGDLQAAEILRSDGNSNLDLELWGQIDEEKK